MVVMRLISMIFLLPLSCVAFNPHVVLFEGRLEIMRIKVRDIFRWKAISCCYRM